MLQISVSKLLDQGGGFWRFGAICNSAHYSAKAAFGSRLDKGQESHPG
jgi:hypothetical protein